LVCVPPELSFDFFFGWIDFWQCIYGLPGQARLVSQWVCPVAHHVTCPSWYDEIKVELPTPLTARHHLLFTFVHVSCEVAKQRRTTSSSSSSAAAAAASDVQSASAGAETVVGFSWLPLLHKGRLRVEAQALPVAAQLPAGYLSFEPLGLGRGVSVYLLSTFLFFATTSVKDSSSSTLAIDPCFTEGPPPTPFFT